MASCGSQTPERLKENNRVSSHDQACKGLFRLWTVRKLVWFIVLSLLVGCSMTLEYGSQPKVKNLGTLKPGISSKPEVLAVLGEPRGHGATRLSSVPTLREIWFYEYTVARGKFVYFMILLVFFDKELYDGHLWFSSVQLLEVTY